MKREAFYAHLRKRNAAVFGTSLSARQVTAIEALLDEVQGMPLSHAAHVLGEVYHETGGGMYPVKETVFRNSKDQNPSDKTVIARLDRAYAKGQLPWVKTVYWRSGWFGRGGIQLTHKANYVKMGPIVGADLVGNPSLALDPVISARIAARGCNLGSFTGKKLSDYDDPGGFDHFNARDIVNGDKRLNGYDVVGYAAAFEDALDAAGHVAVKAAPKPVTETTKPARIGWVKIFAAFIAVLKGGWK